jgi:hypothetical protein
MRTLPLPAFGGPAKVAAWRRDPIHPDNLAAWFKAQGAEK